MLKFKDFNHDQELRDSKLVTPEWVIKHGFTEYLGGVRHFSQMDADTLQWMVDNKFADPQDKQNDAPTLGRFLTFLKQHPNFRAIGYVVDKSRGDYRLTVEGAEGWGLSEQDIWDFTDLAYDADEFVVGADYARAWYD